jgi:hypothetical protein
MLETIFDDLGGDILRFLPLSPSEVNNGFNFIGSLEKKGWINPKEHTLNGNQIINKTLSEWSKGYYTKLVGVLEKVSLQFPNYMSKSLKGGIEQYKEQLGLKTEPSTGSNNKKIERISSLKMVS